MSLRSALSTVLTFLLRPLPARVLANLASAFVDAIARRDNPRAALRLLFTLQSRLDTLIGTTAVGYGEGIHPKHRIMRYHDFFVERVRAGERVLDVGSGNGYLAHKLATEADATVVGVEIVAANLAKARARFVHPKLEFREADVTRALPAEPFDVVVMSNVLEHLPARVELLAGLARTTGAARFLIRVPCFDRDWTVPLRKELGLDWRMDSTHETEYTMQSFRDEMALAGFEIVESRRLWGEIWAVAVPKGQVRE
ncbi:MAG: class I SAM-dependent methyltransferase [Proteobacteria bacterium]|nr:class I SAM-dependent methyltransferase [Pseudomonadota bacterium]